MEDNKEIKNEEIKEEIVEETENNTEENVVIDEAETQKANEASEEAENAEEDDLSMLKEQNKKLQEELDEAKDRLLRLTAEYDNYRKRTTKEKEGIYSDAYVDVLKEILPIMDNLERAVDAEGSLEDLRKGIEMTMKGCQDSFTKLGVEEIDASGEFDPNYHNAVMHIEDENLGKNVVAEVFQKGYKKEDKIIRHTMVKVAN
ncbi:protein GrpE [Clostridium saccharobutylicum]|uniref:nucleotide exchange factor GrpE n=1 Tax=Clostridium saccharobutylicum TaxID=169679 RepID=UPI000983BA6C|nr:nucleotide exchange factor GrpE [Clostridium saccharobutylicum]AQS09002.1 protein GrpE [Clostridium saccharobutylicum]MBC2435489.1 nucleotide exchange factor GrpE [Clostridium saccharobutylicum]NSB87236.1 molecular chaperone GrpE [Clostridium saccharobutylicum]NYC28642.1 molecular chaperone GrpE [Clostridium saccharobutylicum]OOM18325.1 protein GrpE [Clostridium saccharobutylicum]